jgi:hypothetical protein
MGSLHNNLKGLSMKNLIAVLLAFLSLSSISLAETRSKSSAVKKPTRTHVVEESKTYSDGSRTSHKLGPWDFSGTLGLDNPGVVLEFNAAYRVSDYVVEDLDDSLSIESGLGFITVSDNWGPYSYSYTAVMIPIMARWDIHLRDSKFTLSPRAGFDYLTGGSQTVNGVNVSTRGGALYFQVGGVGFYDLSDRVALRAGLAVGGFTTINFGVTYFL